MACHASYIYIYIYIYTHNMLTNIIYILIYIYIYTYIYITVYKYNVGQHAVDGQYRTTTTNRIGCGIVNFLCLH